MQRRTLLSFAAAAALHATVTQAAPTKGTEKIIGLSLPLSGVQAEVGKDLEQGYRLALKANGSDYQMLVLDDAGEAARTATNVQAFVGNSNVIAMSAIVGTPHAQAAIPVATAGGLPIVGIRSGAKSLRDGRSGVYHLRSSYEDELDAIARMCSGMGLKAVGIIHSADSFGEGSRKHLVAALNAKGIAALPPMPVQRDGSDIPLVAAKCAAAVSVQDTTAGVVLLMISKPMSDAAKELREKHKILLPIIAMSFTATKSITSDVIPHLSGLGLVSAFPIPATSISELSRQFRRDCDKHGVPELKGTLTAFEGYFYASVLLKTGAQSRAEVVQKMNAGVRIVDQLVKPDIQMVGYRYLEVVMKTSDGKLRS